MQRSLTDVPLQSKTPPDTVFRADHAPAEASHHWLQPWPADHFFLLLNTDKCSVQFDWVSKWFSGRLLNLIHLSVFKGSSWTCSTLLPVSLLPLVQM